MQGSFCFVKEAIMSELWKRLIYHGIDYGDYYEVSNLGEIRNAKTKKLRKKNVLTTGYYYINVSLGGRDKKKIIKVHRAVAETFLSKVDDCNIINHIDGNKLNNVVSNLEWCTTSYNLQHAYDNGLRPKLYGEACGHNKLTYNDVEFIRKNYIPYDTKLGTRGLARKFNVDHDTIRSILNYETWNYDA